MQVFVGRDDHRRHLGPLQQFAVISSDEISADLAGHQLGTLGVLLGDADPVYLRMARRDFAAKQADPARADDGEANAFGFAVSQRAPPAATASAGARLSGKVTT